MAATEEQFINKLILLYIFDQCSVALIEDIIVNDIATANGWISYMDCKDAIADLIKTDYLVNAAGKNSVPRYKITPDGRECLNCFFYKIPASTRDAIKEHIKKNIMSYRKQQEETFTWYLGQNLPKVQAAQVAVSGDWVLFVIGENAGAAVELFQTSAAGLE